ncbi:MAG: hypothetical protein H0U40_05895 [Chloroflexia bacterium]|nr:hypothetical protein [Chloroflexia bacterium]
MATGAVAAVPPRITRVTGVAVGAVPPGGVVATLVAAWVAVGAATVLRGRLTVTVPVTGGLVGAGVDVAVVDVTVKVTLERAPLSRPITSTLWAPVVVVGTVIWVESAPEADAVAEMSFTGSVAER